jgi:MFS family permease
MTLIGVGGMGLQVALGWLADHHGLRRATQACVSLALLATAWAGACALKGRLVWFETWERPLELWAVGSFLIAAATWLVRMGQWRG